MMKPRWLLLLFLAMAFIAVGGYLLASSLTYTIGFPLDDAWIHQTYARNLWRDRAWAFIPNIPSAGSTAPLWSAIMAIGYGLGLDAYWAYAVGMFFILLLAILCWLWLHIRQRQANRFTWLVGLLILFEWHLVWAAASGMEILLSALLVALILYWLDAERGQPAALGLLIGISVWVRPDLALLVIPVCWNWLWQLRSDWKRLIRLGLSLAAGVALALTPYALFNYLIGGTVLPNTFYAKQAEYSILVQQGFLSRLLDQLMVPLVGVGVVLLPGVLYSVYWDARDRRIHRLAPLIWIFTMMVLYALRLPVTYQHGRYLMPTLPVWTVLGLEGLLLWVQPGSAQTLRRVVSRAWLTILLVVGVMFWFLGGRAYARDVAIIETEMVASSKWIAANTPQDSLVAAHDIGALGYFGQRRILDLAGLISPEVIPFIRDEARLSGFLKSNQADYLMTFPGWYPRLVEDKKPIFITGAEFSPAAGGENMAVYELE